MQHTSAPAGTSLLAESNRKPVIKETYLVWVSQEQTMGQGFKGKSTEVKSLSENVFERFLVHQ